MCDRRRRPRSAARRSRVWPSSAATASWSSRVEPVATPAGDDVHGVAHVEEGLVRLVDPDRAGGRSSQAGHEGASTVMSRSPPWASLRSGSRLWARSPWRACRALRLSTSCGQPACGRCARQSCETVERAAATTSGSPATHCRSSRPTAAVRSPDATVRHWLTVRTAVVELHAGVPDGVPDAVGEAAQVVAAQRAAVVQQHQVHVAERTGVTAGRGCRPRPARCPRWVAVEGLVQTSASQSRVRLAMASRRAGPAPGASKPLAPARSRRRAARSVSSIVTCTTVPSRRFRTCASVLRLC